MKKFLELNSEVKIQGSYTTLFVETIQAKHLEECLVMKSKSYLKVRKTQERKLNCVSFFFFLTKSKVQLLIEFGT
jgi:hypothetical protein